MMRVYLDNCCFNRPFDDQSSLTVRLETEAILDVLRNIESGIISLGWSYILDFENNSNPFLERRVDILKWKTRADFFIDESPEILDKMDELISIEPAHKFTKPKERKKTDWNYAIEFSIYYQKG